MDLNIKTETFNKKQSKICYYNDFRIIYSTPSIYIEKVFNPFDKIIIRYASLDYFKISDGIFYRKNTVPQKDFEDKYHFIEKNAESEALAKINITKETLEEIVKEMTKK